MIVEASSFEAARSCPRECWIRESTTSVNAPERDLEFTTLDRLDRHWAELMTAAQNGDMEAYRQLLTGIVPLLRAGARRHHAAHECEDVVQEILLSVHRVRHTYDPSRSFRRWLLTIARRRSVDRLRIRGRIGKHEDWLSPELAAHTRDTDVLESYDADLAPVLARAIDALPASQRQAIDLVKLRELSLAEASAHSGVSVTSLKVSVHRAMKNLKQHLAGTRDDPAQHGTID